MYESINSKIRELVTYILELPDGFVRPVNQTALAGGSDDPFATVAIIAVTDLGLPVIRNENESSPSNNVSENITNQVKITASIQFFRDSAIQSIQKLKLLIRSSMAIQKMSELGIGLVSCSNWRDLTGVVSTEFEERAQIDIDFHVIVSETISVPTVGVIPITITDEKGSLTFEVTEP